MISIQNVSKTYMTATKTIEAVKNCNLTIYDGEIFGIIGYSGAGKSSLIRLLNALEQPTKGDIYIDDVKINALKGDALRRKRMKIGMIFQHFNLLWSRTVEKNIELPLEIAKVNKEVRKTRVKELIRLVGLEGKEKAYPSELSGGQKQRVGIARALANNPSILLCDEATSALDPTTTESILDLLKEINQKLNLTIVMITHQMEVVQKVCHRIAVMSEGEIVEVGTVKKIFEEPTHPVTKRFIHEVSDNQKDEEMMQNLSKLCPKGMIIRLTFSTENSKEPILATVIKNSSLDVSIIHANLSHSNIGSFGFLTANVTGEDLSEYQKLIEELENNNVKVEVLRNV